LIQLLVFAQFPIVIDRSEKTVRRGSRIHLEGKLKGQVKALPGDHPTYHVRVAQNERAVFLWRTQNHTQASEMAALINEYLRPSLSDAEIGEDAFDHVG
jgi:hypothetical protein